MTYGTKSGTILADRKTAPAVYHHPEARTTKGYFMDTTKDTAPTTTRELRGLKLYREHGDEIIHEGHGRYEVPSCSGDSYVVDLAVFGGEESCSCPDRAAVCKHLIATSLYRAKSRARSRREQAERTAAGSSRASLAPLVSSL